MQQTPDDFRSTLGMVGAILRDDSAGFGELAGSFPDPVTALSAMGAVAQHLLERLADVEGKTPEEVLQQIAAELA